MAVSLHVFGHLVFVGNKFMSSYPSLTSISYNYIIYTQLYTCIFIIFVDFAGPCCMFHILFPRQKLDHTPGQAKGPKGQRAKGPTPVESVEFRIVMAVELWSGLLLVVCIGKCAKDRLQRCFYTAFKAWVSSEGHLMSFGRISSNTSSWQLHSKSIKISPGVVRQARPNDEKKAIKE